MKILYFGSTGDLSLQPLHYLLHSNHRPCAVAVAGPSQPAFYDERLPVSIEHDGSVTHLAREAMLPIIDMSQPLEKYVAAIEQLAPDLILVSCYAKKLPRAILDIPVLGCFNLHPSVLPAYRGPVPLFWQFRDGLSEFGVCLHRVTDRLDAGPVVAQNRLVMPDGVNHARANQLVAQAYIEMLPGFLEAVATGSLSAIAQDESIATSQTYPQADDFRVDSHWSAKRIFNFISATGQWGHAYPCRIEGNEYALHSVLGYSEVQLPDENCVINGNTIQIVCSPGVLLARLSPV